MEWQQVEPRGLGETSSALREGIGKLTLETRLERIEDWRLRLEASGVPEPVSCGLARLEVFAGLLEHEGWRLAEVQR